jgi:lipid A 3-O-deacylase
MTLIRHYCVGEFILFLITFFLLLPVGPAEAQRTGIGARAGYSTDNFKLYEGFVSRSVSTWRFPTAFLDLRLEGSAGALRKGGRSSFTASVGPALALGTGGGRLEIELGGKAGYLDRYQLDSANLGGRFQFMTHIAVMGRITPLVGLGYRYQHISNANIYDRNPGVDLHMVQIQLNF